MRPHPTSIRALGALTITLTLGFGISACGSDESEKDTTTSQVSTTEHNDADVEFATDMIQHHAQTLSMVDLTIDRDLDPDVQQLAEDIRLAQGPEDLALTGWLTDWNEKIPETMRGHGNADHDMPGMDEMDSDMFGTVSADDMQALEDAHDADFQTMWLGMMIEHHEGAIEMAKTETEQGQYKPAVDMAKAVATTQTKEIDTMKDLLD